MNLLGFIFSSSSLFISVYYASKFAKIGLTEALACEVGGGYRYMQSARQVWTPGWLYHTIYSEEPNLKPKDVARGPLHSGN